MKIIATLCALFVLADGSFWDGTSARFVRNYYEDRNIRQIVVFGCSEPHDYLKFARETMQLDTRINFAAVNEDLDMRIILRVNYYAIGVVLVWDCPRSDHVLDSFTEHRLVFNESYHWLILTNNVRISTSTLARLPLSVETELTVAERRNNFTYVMHDVYNPSHRHNGLLNVTFRGNWTREDGLKDVLTQYKYNRRGNFHGLALNFSIVLTQPALPDWDTYLTTPVNRHLDTMTRYHYALVLQLRDTYNFTINLQKAKTWGYLMNGTWNGILADMIDGKVDISVAPFQYKEERMDVCEFTVETYVVRPCFIFRHPKKSSVRNPFLKPFVPEVWYVVAAFVAICYIILSLTMRLEKKLEDEEYDWQMTSGMDVVIAAITQQGTVAVPRIISGRIGFLFLFLWGLLLYQFYSASIVGSLLAEQPRFITTTDDLADSNIDVWFEDMVYYYDFFRTTNDPAALAMYDKKVKPSKQRPNGSYTNAVKGLDMVKKGGYAFHIDIATAYKIISETFTEDEICDLQEIEMLVPKKVTIVTAKKSPFKKMIIYGLRRMVQHGITSALTKLWVTSRPKCPDGHSAKPVPVQAEEFSPAIFLLLLGSTVAVIIMGLEHCHRTLAPSLHPNDFSRATTRENSVNTLTEVADEMSEEVVNSEDVV